MKVCSCAAPSASRPCEVGGSTAIKVSACLCYVTFEIGRVAGKSKWERRKEYEARRDVVYPFLRFRRDEASFEAFFLAVLNYGDRLRDRWRCSGSDRLV